MRSASLIGLGSSRAFRAVVLIVTLFLGATFHEWHHAMEACSESGSHGAEHACACTVLHTAALLAAAQDAPLPVRVAWRLAWPDAPSVPVAAPGTLATSRAPPAA